MNFNKNIKLVPDEHYTYKYFDNIALPMEIYYPKNGLKQKNKTILFIHGGGWESAITDNSQWDGGWLRYQAYYFAMRDFVTITISYRSVKYSENTDITDLISDCTDAVEFIHKLPYVDTKNLILFGESAGGHLAIELGITLQKSLQPLAVIGINPVLDCTKEVWRYCSKNSQTRRIVSPLFNIKKTNVKFLVTHGDNDEIVDVNDTIQFAEKMKEVGNSCEIIIVSNAKHAYLLYGYISSDDFINTNMLELENYINKVLEYKI